MNVEQGNSHRTCHSLAYELAQSHFATSAHFNTRYEHKTTHASESLLSSYMNPKQSNEHQEGRTWFLSTVSIASAAAVWSVLLDPIAVEVVDPLLV